MEGIVLELEALGSPWVLIGEIAAWAVVAGVILLGRMADQERSGRRMRWAEWPFSETDARPADEEFRNAA